MPTAVLTTPAFLATTLPCLALLIYAAGSDIASRRIPNWVSLAVLLLAGLRFLLTGADPLVPLLLAAIVFAVGFLLFLTKLLGAGDSKLAAALVLFLEPVAVPTFLFVMSIAGGILALFTVSKGLIPKVFPQTTPGSGPEGSPEGRSSPQGLPYGVAIAAGGIFALLSFEPGIREWVYALLSS